MKNSANYTQTLHSTLHLTDFPRVTECIVCVPNPAQTLHKPYMATLHKTPQRTCTGTLHRNPAQDSAHDSAFCFLNMNNANGASVLFVVRVCQNAHFGFTLEGASEWLRCKALRMRAQGVY